MRGKLSWPVEEAMLRFRISGAAAETRTMSLQEYK
jgi:hypothetical protein